MGDGVCIRTYRSSGASLFLDIFDFKRHLLNVVWYRQLGNTMPESGIFQRTGQDKNGFISVIDGIVVNRDRPEECVLINLLNTSRTGILGFDLSVY